MLIKPINNVLKLTPHSLPETHNNNKQLHTAPDASLRPSANFATYLKAQRLFIPSFGSHNFLDNIPTYLEQHNYAKPTTDIDLILRIKRLKTPEGKSLYKKEKDIYALIDGLRQGEVRDFQFKALHTLSKNPKFQDPNTLTKFVSQINTIERGNLFLSKAEEYSKKYPDISDKELIKIIPRIEIDKLEYQEKFIDKIYMKYKENKIDVFKFAEILSTLEDPKIAELQLNFFEQLMREKEMTPQIAISLVENIDNNKIGRLKISTALSLLSAGINPVDLPIIMPKIKNANLVKLNKSMVEYFINQLKMPSEIAARMMINIPNQSVFDLHKNIISDITKLRDFENIDLLKILGDIQSPETADLKTAVINELSKIDKLDGYDIMHIVTNVDNIYGAEIKVKIAKELAQIPNLSGKNIGYIATGCHNEDSYKVKVKAAKELVKIPGMTGSAITTIVSKLLKEETADIQLNAVKRLIEYNKFDFEEIAEIVKSIRNIDFMTAKFKALNQLKDNPKLNNYALIKILSNINGDTKDKYLLKCIGKMTNDNRFSPNDVAKIARTMSINKHTCDKFIDYFATIPTEIRAKINDYSVIQDFYPFKDKSYLNKTERKALLAALIKNNTTLLNKTDNATLNSIYTFLPKSSEDFANLFKILSNSIYNQSQILSDEFLNSTQNYFSIISNLYKEDSAFKNINFEKENYKPILKYPREKFIADVKKILSGLTPTEMEKVTDHFGFILEENNNITTMVGYPIIPKTFLNINKFSFNQSKIMQLLDVIVEFTENNEIKICDDKNINKTFNEIFQALPELYTLVDKKQNDYHDFDTFVHTLRVVQEVIKNERFNKLSESDKNLLVTAAFLHDVTKREFIVDKGHSFTAANDAYQIAKRFDFSDTDRSKLYAIIRNHEWLKYYNKEGISELQKTERAKTIAFSLREGNAFDLVSILSDADLKGMKRYNQSYELFKDAQKEGDKEVSRYIRDLQRTAIPLPQIKLPKASEIITDGVNVREADIGGIKNKVIYLYKNMTKGSLPFDKNLDPSDFNVLVHALESETNSLIFQKMDEVDFDSLISASYVNLVKGNWKVFRQQGFILDVDSDNIHAAYFKDFGSGSCKNIDKLKLDYLFEGFFKPQRDYISQKIKEKLHIDSEAYKSLYQDIKNKSLIDIRKKYPFVSSAIKQIYMEMQGGAYTYGRNYNEVLLTRPKIQGVFAYDRSITQVPRYLRKYAEDADIPIIIFMD